MAPEYLCKLLKIYIPGRDVRSATQNLLHQPSYRRVGYHAFLQSTPRLWNETPNDIKNCLTMSLFKKMTALNILLRWKGAIQEFINNNNIIVILLHLRQMIADFDGFSCL